MDKGKYNAQLYVCMCIGWKGGGRGGGACRHIVIEVLTPTNIQGITFKGSTELEIAACHRPLSEQNMNMAEQN